MKELTAKEMITITLKPGGTEINKYGVIETLLLDQLWVVLPNGQKIDFGKLIEGYENLTKGN